MHTLAYAFGCLYRDESGATAIEYSMLASLVAVGCIAAFTIFGNGLVDVFGSTESGAGGAIATAAGKL